MHGERHDAGLRTRRRAVTLLTAFLLCPVIACSSADGTSTPIGGAFHPAPTAIGWRIEARGEAVREGGVETDPPGREKLLMVALPAASRLWAIACAGDAGATGRQVVELRLSVQPNGEISSARAVSTDPMSACLAHAATGARLQGFELATATRATLRLLLVR